MKNKTKYVRKIRQFLKFRLREIGIFFFMFSIVYLSMGVHLGVLPPKIEKIIENLTTIKEAQAQGLTDQPIYWWDSAEGDIPADWTCLSCSGGTYDNYFPLASASVGITNGDGTHNHGGTATPTVSVPSVLARADAAGTALSSNDHTSTLSGDATISSSGGTRPKYATLKMIKAPASLTTIPENVIAMFDSAPGGTWSSFTTYDDYILMASDSAGVGPGGLDTHSHTVTWPSITDSSGTSYDKLTGGSASPVSHTHTAPSNTAMTGTNVPAHTSVLLYKAGASGEDPIDTIAMFDIDSPDSGEWDILSDASDVFDNAFIEASSSYSGAVLGSHKHSHTHASGLTGAASGTGVTTDDSPTDNGALHQHTHTETITTSEFDHRPSFKTVVVAKCTWTAPAAYEFTQNDFRFYVNSGNEDVTEPWGNPDLAENGVLTAVPVTNDAPASGSGIRIRWNITVTSAELSANSQAFRIKFVAGTDCPSIASTSYADVGASTSSSIWRFNDQNNQISDGGTLTTSKLSTSGAVPSGSYVESNPTVTNPSIMQVSENMEWDFTIQNNGATDAATYCFRLQKSDESDLETYNSDSFPKIDTKPGVGNLLRHGNFFAGEEEKGFFWAD